MLSGQGKSETSAAPKSARGLGLRSRVRWTAMLMLRCTMNGRRLWKASTGGSTSLLLHSGCTLLCNLPSTEASGCSSVRSLVHRRTNFFETGLPGPFGLSHRRLFFFLILSGIDFDYLRRLLFSPSVSGVNSPPLTICHTAKGTRHATPVI
jgi:hypothetical protein